ncbi:twin-arginine translocation pathway signal protein [Pseudomonas sp.]|uniref:twin-arginine translocation pathway signal protein n=1 Tax=Pseudomonas sp. TaxID=306 RepID=UPI002579DA6C|nr:twin-arginine translocation pathway signal protein [Pseudomonas sp.]
MTDTSNTLPDLSRRNLLKVGVMGSAFLATAGVTATLSGCSASKPGTGMQALRDTDLPMLSAIIPAILAGAVAPEKMPAAIKGTLSSIDASLAHLSPELLKMTLQLFDLLSMGITRGPLTGIWGSWQKASIEDVNAFLLRWQNSSLAMLNMGYGSLVQLVQMSWYGRKESWAHCGYPGPPTV